MPKAVRLVRPLERTLYAGHPWLYREALAPHRAEPGEPLDILDKRGRVLARGIAEAGPIAVRVFTTDPRESVDDGLFARRVDAALALRARCLPAETTAYRLMHGEGDRLPGVVVDRYGSAAVLKLDGEAILAHRAALVRVLQEKLPTLGIASLLVRTSRKVGQEVALAFGPEPAPELEVQERGMTLLVNLREGQKTGLFLDHRETRYRVRGLATGLRVLNLYGYTGGFSVAAALGGATHVTTVDIGRPAIELAERTFVRNGLAPEKHRAVTADVPEYLAELARRDERFGLIVADPPNFAPSQKTLDTALDAYCALHAGCLGRLESGALYLAASCSSHVRSLDFLDTLREGARRARRVVTVLEQHHAPFDHPRLLAFPEGDYLKIVLARVD